MNGNLYCKWKDTYCNCVDEDDGTCCLWYGCKYDLEEDNTNYREPWEDEL